MNQEKIGKFIAECRKEKKLTQFELAEKLGVTDKSVSNWENGKNMPDISLFNSLCQELGISVNDLLSGEKVDEKDYKNKLESNIVNMIVNDKKKRNKKLKYVMFIIITFFVLYSLGNFLYNTIEFDVKYEPRTMKCSFSDNELLYEISGTSVLNTDYIEKKIDGKTYFIFHSTISLVNKRHSNFEYGYSFAQVFNGKRVPFSSNFKLDHFKDNEQISVYYSNQSIDHLDKLSDSKFLKKVKTFYQMCHNK